MWWRVRRSTYAASWRNAGISRPTIFCPACPFRRCPRGVGEEIVSETAAALRPGGEFLVYQYSAFVRPLLEPRFAHVQDRRVWMNIPPARIFRATRAAALARAA